MANVVADKLEQAIRIKDQIRTAANAKNAGIPEGAAFADYPGYLEDLPEQLENVPIVLDFSGGDLTITAAEGTVVKSAIIQKPANLVPENIKENEVVAGIVGALAAGGGGLDDWNCAIGIVTSDGSTADDTPITVISASELIQKGFVISSKSSVNDLKTMIFITRISTASSTSGTTKRLNFSFFQNWQLSNNGSSTFYNGVYDYQSAATATKVYESYMSTDWRISGATYPVSLSPDFGLAVVRNQYASFAINGTYIVGVIQHKTARVCDTLT